MVVALLLLLLDPKPNAPAARGTPPNGLGTVLAEVEEGPADVEAAAEEGAGVGARAPLRPPAPPKKPPEREPPLLPNEEDRTSPAVGVPTTGGFISEDVDGVAGATTVARGAGAVGAGKAAPKVPDADRPNGFTAAVVACCCD
jgi:hypothetical protein